MLFLANTLFTFMYLEDLQKYIFKKETQILGRHLVSQRIGIKEPLNKEVGNKVLI